MSEPITPLNESAAFKEKFKEATIRVIKARGNVVQGAIDIETLMNTLILSYFVDSKKQSDFLISFLLNPSFNNGVKIEGLLTAKIIDEPLAQNLRDFFAFRNLFAHASLIFDQEKDPNFQLINKKVKPVDITEEHDKFIKLFQKIHPILNKKIAEFLKPEAAQNANK